MSNQLYLKKISSSFEHYKITNERTEIKLPQELLKTILNYEIFYIPERNEIMASSKAVFDKYLSNPVVYNIGNEIIYNSNFGQKYNIFKGLIQNGITNIKYSIEQSNEIYLDHCLYVISMLYGCFLFNLDSNFSFVENVGWTNVKHSIIGLSSMTKYGYERLIFNKQNLERNDKYRDLVMIPIFLPCIYSSYAGKLTIQGMNYQVCERLSIISEIELCQILGFNVVKDFNYFKGLYNPLGESYIPYYLEIARVCVPKDSKCQMCKYDNRYAQMYGKNIEGIAYSYQTEWMYKKLTNSIHNDNVLKELISENFEKNVANVYIKFAMI